MQNAKRYHANKRRNEHKILWVFREMAKWRQWRLTATAVATDLHCRLSNRSLKHHIAGVKNITGDDQVTLRVDQNSAAITQSFETYVYEIGTDTARLTVNDSCHQLMAASS